MKTSKLLIIQILAISTPVCLFFFICYLAPYVYTTIPVPVEIVKNQIQEIYGQTRDVIQLNPNCGRYDPYLGYTLRPGSCRFKNVEFDTTVLVNSAGLRDDEDSLSRPHVIALGDSFTMGWGVEQEQSFPQIIERRLGKKTLNAGISSFDTVREFMLLERLDLSNAKYIIIQYNKNDRFVNKKYITNGFINASTEEIYNSRIKEYNYKRKSYTNPGFHIIRKIWSKLPPSFQSAVDKGIDSPLIVVKSESEEAENFFQLLSVYRHHFLKKKLLILRIQCHNQNTSQFIPELRERASNSDLDFLFVDVGEFLSKDDYFVLDGHINPSGHRKVARAILATISNSD